jgi:hypothetical protein
MQDSVFIPDREMILAAVGIGIALVLLGALAILQHTRRRREGLQRLDEGNLGSTKDALPGATPFFVACYRGSSARFFRVYFTPAELLFLHAGQYFAIIDAETPRGSDQTHWLLRSVKLVFVALAGGAVAAGIGLAAVIRGVARNAGNNPEGARDILLWVLGIIAFCAVMVVVCVPVLLWQYARRCRQLDALRLSELREMSETDRQNFRATPESVPDLEITPLVGDAAVPGQIACAITFKHARTGRWKIETLTTRDTRDAVQAVLTVWGQGRVLMDKSLQDRFATLPAPAAARTTEPTDAVAELLRRANLR